MINFMMLYALTIFKYSNYHSILLGSHATPCAVPASAPSLGRRRATSRDVTSWTRRGHGVVSSGSRDAVAPTALPDVAVSGCHGAMATPATPEMESSRILQEFYKNSKKLLIDFFRVVLLHFQVKSMSLGSLLEAYGRLQARA